MDCIAQIMEFYNKKIESEKESSQLSKVWLSNLLIKLMRSFNNKAESIDNLRLRNCLILLINLFSNNDSPDHYNKKGKSVQDITGNEKTCFKDILSAEFINK